MNMFEKASRLKLRFETTKGFLIVEDLWDLPLLSSTNKTCLDDIARNLHRAIRDGAEESFVVKKTPQDSVLQLKFSVVKHIIDVKMQENEAKELAKQNKEKKQRILSILAEKQDEALKGKSEEELLGLLNSL